MISGAFEGGPQLARRSLRQFGMVTDSVPIAVFVNRKVLMAPLKAMIEPLQLDIQVVANLLIAHFHDMGIFFVPPAQEGMFMTQIIKQLRISPEIQRVALSAASQRARANKAKRA
jgi:hypothetical protein